MSSRLGDKVATGKGKAAVHAPGSGASSREEDMAPTDLMRTKYIGSEDLLRDGFVPAQLQFQNASDADEVQRAVDAFTLMDVREREKIGFPVINGRVEVGHAALHRCHDPTYVCVSL